MLYAYSIWCIMSHNDQCNAETRMMFIREFTHPNTILFAPRPHGLVLSMASESMRDAGVSSRVVCGSW